MFPAMYIYCELSKGKSGILGKACQIVDTRDQDILMSSALIQDGHII